MFEKLFENANNSIFETITELIHEIPSLDEFSQTALAGAIDLGLLSNNIPPYSSIMTDLKNHPDVEPVDLKDVDWNKVADKADVHASWVEKIALPNARQAVLNVDVDQLDQAVRDRLYKQMQETYLRIVDSAGLNKDEPTIEEIIEYFGDNISDLGVSAGLQVIFLLSEYEQIISFVEKSLQDIIGVRESIYYNLSDKAKDAIHTIIANVYHAKNSDKSLDEETASDVAKHFMKTKLVETHLTNDKKSPTALIFYTLLNESDKHDAIVATIKEMRNG